MKGNIRESQLEDYPRVHNYASAYINKLNQIVAQQKEVLDSTNAAKAENASNKKFQDLVNKFVERAKLESNDRSAKSGLGVVKPAERRNARKKPVEQSDQEPVDASKTISVQQEIILESNEVDSVSSDNSAQDENTNGRSFWYDSFTDLISTLKSTFTNYVSGTNDALRPSKRASDDDLSDDGFGQMMKYEQTAEENKFATETRTEETLDLASMVDFPTLASVVGKPGSGTKPTYASIARNGAGQKSGSLDRAMTSAMMQSGSNNQSKSKTCNGYINCPGCNAIVYCKCGENVFDRDTDDEDIGDESIACPGCNRRIPRFDINGNLRCLPDSNCKIVHVKQR